MIFKQSIWLVGFRPFFLLSILSGILLPAIWVYLYLTGSSPMMFQISPLKWHAHEMLFGFGWAALGGFLLTASKNWVKIRGLHGGPLAFAVFLWLIERVTLPLLPTSSLISLTLSNISAGFLILYLMWTLYKYRANDFFPDNYLFLVGLPLLLLSKNLLLSDSYFRLGQEMAVAFFRLSFVIMFERTMTQHMKNTFHIVLPRRVWLDSTIKHGMLLAILTPLAGPTWDGALMGLLGLLLLSRFSTWSPHIGFKSFATGTSYAGYFGLTVHLLLKFVESFQLIPYVGTLSTHVFTFFCMGIVIPAMFIRIAHGHTGRKIIFTTIDQLAITLMFIGGLFRTLIPQFNPQNYMIWVGIAGICWSFCFTILGFRLTPLLCRKRVDGREH